MFWTIDSITEAKELFPDILSLWEDSNTTNDLGNMTNAEINWDYLYDKVRSNFTVHPDYRIPHQERTENDVRDYTQWSVSKIYIVPHSSLKHMDRICSCQNARLENEDPSELTGRTAHHDHDEVHRLHNALAIMNQNGREVPAGGWNQDGSVNRPYYLQQIIRDLRKQYDQRFLGSRVWRTSSKHRFYRRKAERVIGDNLHYIIFIHADENGIDRCYSQGYIIPYVEAGTTQTKLSHGVAYSLNEMSTPFYGYYDSFEWDIYEQVIYKPRQRSSIRQYKECKSCLQQVNKNHCVFAINMGRSQGRYSICYLCAATTTAGYDPETKAFVAYPHGIPQTTSRLREFLRQRMLDEDGHIIGTHQMTFVPFFRKIPTTSNSSSYAWVDVSDGHPDWMHQRNIEPHIALSLEARKYLTWAATQEVFQPDLGAYESVGSVGNTFDWFSIEDGACESIQAWDELCDGGINLFENEPDISEDDYELGEVRETSFNALYHDQDIEYYDYNEQPIYDHSLFLTIYDPRQWEDYMSGRRRGGTATPSVRQVIRIERNPIHVVRHGIPEMNLEKNTWDFMFPIWQVAMGNHNDGRLIKPVGQDSWSNPEMMQPGQFLSMERAREQGNINDHTMMVNSQIGPFYGMELEIVGRRHEHQDANDMENTHRRLIEAFHPNWSEVNSQRTQLAYRVQDSSVDSGSQWGHEVVTQPMTLGAWHMVPDEFWTMLRDKYVAMYNEGGGRNYGNGIHIHIDHDAFTTGHLWAFVDYFIRQHQVYMEDGEVAAEETLLYKVAQRGSGRWAHWRYPYHETRRGMIDNVDDIIAATALRRRTDRGGDGKYDGINFVKDNTIELRYFNSTTVQDRVLARLEFVEAVYRMTKQESISLGEFNTREGSENERFREHFRGLTAQYWDDKLWHYVLSTEASRRKYSNLIKLGRETNVFDLNRLFGAHTVYNDTLSQAREFVDALVDITEEGGTQ